MSEVVCNPISVIAAELDRLARSPLDPAIKAAFLRASRALFQQRGGRRPRNDRKLLHDVANLIDAGLVKSERDALTKVAGTVAFDQRSLKATVERLRRKRRKKHTTQPF
jgi:hypothetical protein